MELKKYQKITIEKLASYLKELEKFGPKIAFISLTNFPYNDKSFEETPFICIKIPTGGGKTLVGCHALDEIMRSVLKNKMDRGIVMWFVPSEAIKTQTLKKFKDRNDSHRKILDEAFQNNIRIFSNEEALSIRKEDIDESLCIIISSLDAFRKEKTLQKKYKVYKENGAFLGHFENLQDDKLEKDEEGTIINSLANVVRINDPLIVIDEGHKTKTQLSIEFLKDLNPSFIIEYTATPREGSNILVDIHASDLKEEQMVKIPIVLESTNQWSVALERGIAKRNYLEKEVKRIKTEYIRPIVLIQAQPKSSTSNNITVEHIKEFLINAKIPEEQIAIKTAEKNELEGIDLFSKNCKIKYIITVNALAEGWDCSFAYILISVANIGTKIAVEQIIGRIIRMPYAKKKNIEELNRSYIFASAKNFNEAANQIISGLESNGYSKFDLLNSSIKDNKYELEVQKAVKKELAPPMISLKNEKLSFEDLISEEFKLSKQNHEFNFEIHYDNDGQAIIDIKKDDTWIKGRRMTLNLIYSDKSFTKEELTQWLDKKLRFTLLDKADKVSYISKVIEYQLKKHSLAELSVNRYLLLTTLDDKINRILEEHSKVKFDSALNKKEITIGYFETFPKTIIISQETPKEFNKNYYQKIDKLNLEELNFVERLDLDTLPNIDYWIRNREKKDPFYIQGWKRNKFYPDFIAVTKKGSVIALEWKGEDRISNEDTGYKEIIGKIWERLGKGKLHFFLVHNKNIDETLKKLKNLN